ncbi:unnamed protein product [Orchesella dallaii]|uniref:Mitochondrial GTPase 1 n=1 Tax=Orchesella dallaii TaxID=48710 RepID=A0ABP1QPT4_9HEXA
MSGFRETFGVISRNLNWYPKHMNTGLKQMQAKLRSVDCVLEIHDARVPLSGRNPNFSHLLVGEKPHIVVLNKVDLISSESKRKIKDIYEKTVTKNLIFTNCKNDQDSGVKKIVPMIRDLIENSNRYHRTGMDEYNAMVIGIPNVGKSSFINITRAKNLKKATALKVAPSAGVTKMVHMRVKISTNPLIYLFDTPGILTPRVPDPTAAIKLAVCGGFPDHDVGLMLIADYILFTLNKQKKFRYTSFLGLEEPCDCITTALTKGAIHTNRMLNLKSYIATGPVKKPDFDLMAKMFIDKFRKAEFGKVVLDDIDQFTQFEEVSDDIDLKENEVFERSTNT